MEVVGVALSVVVIASVVTVVFVVAADSDFKVVVIATEDLFVV